MNVGNRNSNMLLIALVVPILVAAIAWQPLTQWSTSLIPKCRYAVMVADTWYYEPATEMALTYHQMQTDGNQWSCVGYTLDDGYFPIRPDEMESIYKYLDIRLEDGIIVGQINLFTEKDSLTTDVLEPLTEYLPSGLEYEDITSTYFEYIDWSDSGYPNLLADGYPQMTLVVEAGDDHFIVLPRRVFANGCMSAANCSLSFTPMLRVSN